MNEILRIHIAGVPYEVDVSAKKQLDKYMTDIKESLGDATDALEDIEIRVTEILAERGVNKNDVVKPGDVKAVKEQLGEPKDFSPEPDSASNAGSGARSSSKRSAEKTDEHENIADKVRSAFAEKRYFRDPENGMIGGVISGFAAYTGWDVTLLRVLFVVLGIFTAIFPFIILYIVVWICAPEARTAADRLSMKGEPINIETIKASAQDFAEKAKTTGRAASEKVQKVAPAAGNLAFRIILGFFGAIGLITFIPCLVALIPVTVIGFLNIATVNIAVKPLFIASAILLAVLLFTVMSIGITVSTALLTAKLGRATRTGLIVSIVFAIMLTIATSITGGLWYEKVGRDEAINTAHSLIDEVQINVHGDDGTRIDVGPVHIDTRR